MARGQQGGVTTGGGVDPYVQAAAGNRLQQAASKAQQATSEAGATKRQAMGDAAETQRTKMQIAAAREQTAMMAAERERGRREDNEFTAMQNEALHKNEMDRTRLRDSLDTAREDKKLDLIKSLAADLDATARVDKLNKVVGGRNNSDMAQSMADAEGRAEEAKEKNTTAEIEALKTHEGMRQQGEVFTNSTILGMLDPSFTYSDMADRLPDLQKQHRERERATLEQTYGGDPAGRVKGKPYEEWDPEKAITRANDEQMMGAIDKQFIQNGLKNVTIDMLQGEWVSRNELETLVSTGEIDASDVPAIRATLEAAKNEMIKRAQTSRTDKDEKAGDFYTDWAGRLTQSIETVRDLNKSKTPIEGKKGVTVGMEMSRGNAWSGEWSPEEFDLERTRISREKRMEITEFQKRAREKPGFVMPDSGLLTEMDRNNPAVMSRIRQNESLVKSRMPQIYGELDPTDPAGELGGY